MEWLNYKHLHYFWEIARAGSIARASQRLKLAQSTLSSQLKDLEGALGQSLFERKQRALVLTEAGRTAMVYADGIFASGKELLDVMKNRPIEARRALIRVGCMSSISKRVQFEFVLPSLTDPLVRLNLVEGSLTSLMRRLQNHQLDVVISNMPVQTDRERGVYNHPVGQIDVWMVGHPKFKKLVRTFPSSLNGVPLFLPTHHSRVRSEIDQYLQGAGVRPEVRGEIEDVALLRIFALEGAGLIVVPEISVADDVEAGRLLVIDKLPSVYETVYAVTASRKFANPHVGEMVKRFSGRYALPGRSALR